jgi:hypothetical protein
VKCIAVAMQAAAVMLIGSAASAQAKATGDTICTGLLYDVTITTNLTVPAGASCTMELLTVDRSVSVGAGADFYFAPFDHLEGNLSAEAADSVTLGVSEFDGNVSVVEPAAPPGSAAAHGHVHVRQYVQRQRERHEHTSWLVRVGGQHSREQRGLLGQRLRRQQRGPEHRARQRVGAVQRPLATR